MPEKIDSKFRFVLVTAHRAEQLMRGARPHIDTAGKKLTRVAQEEVLKELVSWDFGPPPAPEKIEEALPAASTEVTEMEAEEEVH